jgi:hypothetical protein
VAAVSAGTPQLSANIGFVQGIGIEAAFTFSRLRGVRHRRVE